MVSGADLEMVAKLNPALKGYVTTNQEGSTGDGIALAESEGAATVDMEQIQIHPSVEQETSYLITEAVRGEGAILVNSKGERFVNELETRDKVSAAINSLDPNYAYVIFDDALKDRVKAIAQYEEKGLVKRVLLLQIWLKKLVYLRMLFKQHLILGTRLWQTKMMRHLVVHQVWTML